jgi:hypothetical protein
MLIENPFLPAEAWPFSPRVEIDMKLKPRTASSTNDVHRTKVQDGRF